MNKPNCCEKCWSKGKYPFKEGNDVPYCISASCECHIQLASSTPVSDWESKLAPAIRIKVEEIKAQAKAEGYREAIEAARQVVDGHGCKIYAGDVQPNSKHFISTSTGMNSALTSGASRQILSTLKLGTTR